MQDGSLNYMICTKEKEMIQFGFNSAGISKAVDNAQEIYRKIENPFGE